MKKILVALLVLALVAPSFAVTISGSDLGGGKMRLTYNVPAGEVLRGVALKLTTTAGTATITDTAAVTAIEPKFNTFIDYAFSNPTGYAVGTGNPLANPAAAGVLTAFPASTFVLSMGALDQAGAQAGVTGTGTLCEIQYSAGGTIHVEADTMRGGAVVGDAVTQPIAFDVNLAIGYTLTTSSDANCEVTTPAVEGAHTGLSGSVAIVAGNFAAGYQFGSWTGTGVTAGKVANPASASTTITMDADYTVVANAIPLPETVSAPAAATGNATAFITISQTYTTTGGSVSSMGHAVQYRFNFGDGTFSTWGTALTAAKTWTVGGVKSITVEARCATDTAITAVSAPLSVTIQECQFYNLTKKVTTFTPVDTLNVVNATDVQKLITYINTYRASTSLWAVLTTNANYNAGFNLSTAAAVINATDVQALITYINNNRISSTTWAANCAVKP